MPGRGSSAHNSLVSSSRTRSALTMRMRSAIRVIASTVASSTAKPSCAAKRAARSIRSGSSPNEISGLDGVVMIRSMRCSTPPDGSTRRTSGTRRASAFTVKSRRRRSPSSESPKTTSGLRVSPS